MNRDVIAKAAGVSPITVSRVFRNNGSVADETSRRVIEISRQMGYMPNSAARAIRNRRFGRIAFIVTSFLSKGAAPPPNTLAYVSAASDELAARGYSLIFEHFHLEEVTQRLIEPPRMFLEASVDGVIAYSSGSVVPGSVDEKLEQLGAPVIWINRNLQDGVPSIISNDERPTREMVRHLIELGHRRVGYVGYGRLHHSSGERLSAVRTELNAAGLSTDALVCAADRTEALAAVQHVLSQTPRVTALVCYNARVYAAALQVAAQMGLRVPTDLSICLYASHVDMEAAFLPPTAVVMPEPAMSAAAVGLLVQQIEQRTGSQVDTAEGDGLADQKQGPFSGQFRPGATTVVPPAEAN